MGQHREYPVSTGISDAAGTVELRKGGEYMEIVEKLTSISDIAAIAWCAAENGSLPAETFASAFEYITRELCKLISEMQR